MKRYIVAIYIFDIFIYNFGYEYEFCPFLYLISKKKMVLLYFCIFLFDSLSKN